MLVLANLRKPPESVPINLWNNVEGGPVGDTAGRPDPIALPDLITVLTPLSNRNEKHQRLRVKPRVDRVTPAATHHDGMDTAAAGHVFVLAVGV